MNAWQFLDDHWLVSFAAFVLVLMFVRGIVDDLLWHRRWPTLKVDPLRRHHPPLVGEDPDEPIDITKASEGRFLVTRGDRLLGAFSTVDEAKGAFPQAIYRRPEGAL